MSNLLHNYPEDSAAYIDNATPDDLREALTGAFDDEIIELFDVWTRVRNNESDQLSNEFKKLLASAFEYEKKRSQG